MSTLLLSILVCIFGSIIGSFLNVLIHRLPMMITGEIEKIRHPRFNLWIPYSHCPRCYHSIYPLDNIPLISYLLLKGKCRHCRQHISWHYPLIEIITAILTLFSTLHFGVTWQLLFSLIFSYIAIALFFIDLKTYLLPDKLTFLILWTGLIANIFNFFTDLPSAVIGAITGYLTLWLVATIYFLLTKRCGIGNGDFKLLAALGAWFGWQALPCIILLSSLLGVIGGILILTLRKKLYSTPIPYGPYLVVAGWITLMWGNLCLLWV